LEVFEEGKSSGGFPKELLDIGIKSALRYGRKEDAVKLARSGKASASPLIISRIELMGSGRLSGRERLVLPTMLFWQGENMMVSSTTLANWARS
jgi:hypothetical protein